MVHALYTTSGNLYCYGANNPIRYVDPDGNQMVVLSPVCIIPVPVSIIPFPVPEDNTPIVLGDEFRPSNRLENLGTVFPRVYSLYELRTIIIFTLTLSLFNSFSNIYDAASTDDKGDLGQVLDGAQLGRETKGHTRQWDKSGTMNDANNDFDSLNPNNVKEIPGGRIGILPDGRKVNVRDHSSDGRSTLEVQDGKNRIKIRYGEK